MFRMMNRIDSIIGTKHAVFNNSAYHYGGWKKAFSYYEERMLTAPDPDHPIALDAYRMMLQAEANLIGWASRD